MTASSANTTVLLTGFGPFPGTRENVSGPFVHKLAREIENCFSDTTVLEQILPTEWEAGPQILNTIMQRHLPDVCLHFGVSDRAEGFVIESQAYNVCENSEDANGRLPVDNCISQTGPEKQNATFPSDRIVARLKRHHFPVELSTDPGRYLCNTVLYHSLAFDAAGKPSACSGFVHLPTTFSPADNKNGFTFERAIAGGVEIVLECLETKPGQR
ncbi:MAG: pyroglutamyl-peptidase I [Hyphomicrobiaceae bacterium]